MLKSRIEWLTGELVNKGQRTYISELYQIVKCIIANVQSIKQSFLGHLIFDDEYKKLGAKLLKEMDIYKLKTYYCKEARINLSELITRESRSLKRGTALINAGIKMIKSGILVKQDSMEIELNNKFLDLSRSFFKIQKQYDNNEFEDPMPSTENSAHFSP